MEAALLPVAADVSVFRLRELARRELIARDPAVADRRRRLTEKAADVSLRQARDGCAELSVLTATPRAAAIHDAVDRYARMRQADGDPRPIGQLRVEVLEDLVLRPWDTSRPAVTATLTVLAPLRALSHLAHSTGTAQDAEAPVPAGVLWPPAELGGQPITGGQLCALLEQVEALCPGGRQPALRVHRPRRHPARGHRPRRAEPAGPPRLPRPPRGRSRAPRRGLRLPAP